MDSVTNNPVYTKRQNKPLPVDCPNPDVRFPRAGTLQVLLAVVLIFILSGTGSADRLSSNVPENQIFSIDTAVDATGMFEDTSDMSWLIVSRNSTTDGRLLYKQSRGDMVFSDRLLSDGGKISDNENYAFTSENQGRTKYNIENEKVLTYASTEGAHLVGEEQYQLSIAGNWNSRSDEIMCVFSTDTLMIQPAFCNIVTAKSALINVNSAKISARGQMRGVGTATIPAGLNYRIGVTPDSSSGSGFAEGTFRTLFAGSIMEARDIDDYNSTNPNWNNTAAENSWKDASEVTGGVKEFQKRFVYKSGFRF